MEARLHPPHDLPTGVQAARCQGGVTISVSYPILDTVNS